RRTTSNDLRHLRLRDRALRPSRRFGNRSKEKTMKRVLVCFVLASCEQKPMIKAHEAAPPAPLASASASGVVDASPPPTMASHFEAVIGDWSPEKDQGLWVDGTSWRQGTPSASIADQAKRLYGDKSAEFLDGVKAFAFFPLAISDAPPTSKAHVSVRF